MRLCLRERTKAIATIAATQASTPSVQPTINATSVSVSDSESLPRLLPTVVVSIVGCVLFVEALGCVDGAVVVDAVVEVDTPVFGAVRVGGRLVNDGKLCTIGDVKLGGGVVN